MKAGWKTHHIGSIEKPNNIYVKNYENNNSIHNKYENMVGRKEAEDEFDVGRWKIRYFFNI